MGIGVQQDYLFIHLLFLCPLVAGAAHSLSLAENKEQGRELLCPVHHGPSSGRGWAVSQHIYPTFSPSTSGSLCRESQISSGNHGTKSHSLGYMAEGENCPAPKSPLLPPNPFSLGSWLHSTPHNSQKNWDFIKAQLFFWQDKPLRPRAGRAGWDQGLSQALQTPALPKHSYFNY